MIKSTLQGLSRISGKVDIFTITSTSIETPPVRPGCGFLIPVISETGELLLLISQTWRNKIKSSVGGAVEYGEDLLKAGQRELSEELFGLFEQYLPTSLLGAYAHVKDASNPAEHDRYVYVTILLLPVAMDIFAREDLISKLNGRAQSANVIHETLQIYHEGLKSEGEKQLAAHQAAVCARALLGLDNDETPAILHSKGKTMIGTSSNNREVLQQLDGSRNYSTMRSYLQELADMKVIWPKESDINAATVYRTVRDFPEKNATDRDAKQAILDAFQKADACENQIAQSGSKISAAEMAVARRPGVQAAQYALGYYEATILRMTRFVEYTLRDITQNKGYKIPSQETQRAADVREIVRTCTESQRFAFVPARTFADTQRRVVDMKSWFKSIEDTLEKAVKMLMTERSDESVNEIRAATVKVTRTIICQHLEASPPPVSFPELASASSRVEAGLAQFDGQDGTNDGPRSLILRTTVDEEFPAKVAAIILMGYNDLFPVRMPLYDNEKLETFGGAAAADVALLAQVVRFEGTRGLSPYK